MHDETSLREDLARLDLPPGGVVVVHSGFKALGAVAGGPAAVARALVAASTAGGGTLLAPTFTTDLIDPGTWPVPPAPEERARLMEAMPLFAAATSAPHKMGAIAHALWRLPGAVRSDHPVTSWVAHGARAVELTREHPLDDPEGLDGPVGRAYRADAAVLLLGVEHDADTTIHLAESLLEMPHLRALPDRYPVALPGGGRAWRAVAKTTKCSDGFSKLQGPLDRAGVVRRARVGDAVVQLVRSRDIVRVTCTLLAREPLALLCDDAECVHCPTSREVLEGFRRDPATLGLLD